MQTKIEFILKQSTNNFCVEDFAVSFFVKPSFISGKFFNPRKFTLKFHNNGMQPKLLHIFHCVYKHAFYNPYINRMKKIGGQLVHCQ